MEEYIKARSALLCDDIRREDSGKDIVIGIYAGVILIPGVPTTLTNFGVRIEFTTNMTVADDLTVEMRGPDDVPLFSVTGRMEMIGKDGVQVLSVITHNVRFMQAGQYSLFFGRKDNLENVYDIPVRVEPIPA